MSEASIESDEFLNRAGICVELSSRIVERLFQNTPDDTQHAMLLPEQIRDMSETEYFKYKAEFDPYELFGSNEEIREALTWAEGVFGLVKVAFRGSYIGSVLEESETPLIDVIESDYADDFFERIKKIDPNNPDIDIDEALRYIYFKENGDLFRRMLMTDVEVEQFKAEQMAKMNNDRAYITIMLRAQASFLAMHKLVELGVLSESHGYSIFSINYPGYLEPTDTPTLTMHSLTAGERQTVFEQAGRLMSTKIHMIFSNQGGLEDTVRYETEPQPANEAQKRLALTYLQALINQFKNLEEMADEGILSFVHHV